MRRLMSCYFNGLPDFKETRLRLVTLYDIPQLYATLDEVANRWGAWTPEAVCVYDNKSGDAPDSTVEGNI